MSIWNLFKEMEELQTKLDSAPSFLNKARNSFLPGLSARHFPLLNIAEDENNLYVEALAPGLDTNSIEVTATRDRLTISGEKADDEISNESFHRRERATGRFTRTIDMPYPIESEKVTASYKNGILSVTMTKAEEAKPKKITVSLK